MGFGKVTAEAAKRWARTMIKGLLKELIGVAVTEAVKQEAFRNAKGTATLKAQLATMGRSIENTVESMCSYPNTGLSQALVIGAVIPGIDAYSHIDAVTRMQICSTMLSIIETRVEAEFGRYMRTLGSTGRGGQYFSTVFGVAETWHWTVNWDRVNAELSARMRGMLNQAEQRQKQQESRRKQEETTRRRELAALPQQRLDLIMELKAAHGTPGFAAVAAKHNLDLWTANAYVRYPTDLKTGRVLFQRKYVTPSERQALAEAWRTGGHPRLFPVEVELGLPRGHGLRFALEYLKHGE